MMRFYLVLLGILSLIFAMSVQGQLISEDDNSLAERSFYHTTVGPDEEFQVYIDISIDAQFEHHAYRIEENVPSGWTIVDPGVASQNSQQLLWEYNNTALAESVRYEYTVRSPSTGSAQFQGQFIIDGMDAYDDIYGDSVISVGDCNEGDTQICTTAVGCQGEQFCVAGYFGPCISSENYCDLDCDGTQECTTQQCPQCACIGKETRSCIAANGCAGIQNCINGVFGSCVAQESLCDSDCDGDQECSTSCPVCNCMAGETQSCLTVNGCAGEQSCVLGSFGSCVALQNFCDNDCDGTQECTDDACITCECTGNSTQPCLTSNGCDGLAQCSAGILGDCISDMNYCDIDCDGTQECTAENCTPCSCTGSEQQLCTTEEGCTGIQTCSDGIFGPCVIEGFFCDSDCDGTEECSALPCDECGCIEDWTCTPWSPCQDGVEERACTDENSCGTVANRPVSIRSCDISSESSSGGGGGGGGSTPYPSMPAEECKPRWICDGWSGCDERGLKKRECSDENNCNSIADKPSELEECTKTSCSDGLMNGDERGIDCGGNCPPCQKLASAPPRMLIKAEQISGDVNQDFDLSVNVVNNGKSNAAGLVIQSDKWMISPAYTGKVPPKTEKTYVLKLHLPKEPIDTALQLQLLLDGIPVATKNIQAKINRPKYSLTIIKEDDGQVPFAVIDNTGKDGRNIIVSLEIEDHGTIVFSEKYDITLQKDSIYQKSIDKISSLKPGNYHAVAKFYEDGKELGEYVSDFSVEQSYIHGNNNNIPAYAIIAAIMITMLAIGIGIYVKKKKG